MAPTIPTIEPGEFVAGDSVDWNVTDAVYPPSEGWLLSYAFVGPTPFELGASEITSNLVSNIFEVRIPTSITDALEPGTYTWYRYATLAGKRYTTLAGSCVVNADKVAAAPAQTRAERDLAAYTAARDEIVLGRSKAYQIQGRAFTKLDLEFLEKRIGILRGQVNAERRAARGGEAKFGRTVRVRFNGPN